MSDADRKRFSFKRALSALTSGDWREAGYEREVCRQAESDGVNLVHGNGQYSATIPLALLGRDLTAGTNSAGGYAVGSGIPGYVAALEAKSAVLRAGAVMLPGLKGNVDFPRVSGSTTAYWLTDEATAVTESQPTLGTVPLRPKTVGGYAEFSRLLLVQTGAMIERILAQNLTGVVAKAIDAAVIAGSGSGGEPTGIVGTSGIGSFSGTTLGLAGIEDAVGDLASAIEALPDGRFGWVTTPTVASLLRQRQRFASTDTPLWTGSPVVGAIEGMPAFASSAVAAGRLVLGEWSHLAIGQWGVLEVAVNPYANFAGNIYGMRCLVTCDVGVLQPGAFTASTTVS
ncbi:MAG: phage major capsid protein [Burkholderiaceae bacterium]